MNTQPADISQNVAKHAWKFAGALALLLLLAYSNSFTGPLIFDDSGSIRDNPSVRSLWTAFFPKGNSGDTVAGRPVLNFTVAVNYLIGGENVVGYHVGNLLIHACATLLLFGLVRRILTLPSMRVQFGGAANFIAFVTAALWGLHPLQTESVTYIIQRAESLVGMFYFLTLYCFVRAAPDAAQASGLQGSERCRNLRCQKHWLGAAVLACLAGMGSKEVMAGAPIIVFLLDRTFVSGSFKEAWRTKKWFYIALAATWLLLAACIFWTGKRGDTVGFSPFATWWRYGLTQCFAIMHYLKLAVWPSPLVLDYGLTLANDFSEAAWQFGVVMALIVAAFVSLWKAPKISFVLMFFFATLAPSSSVVPVLTQTMAEHRMYLATTAVIALIVFVAYRAFGRRILFIFLPVVLLFGTLTFLRNRDYYTEEIIWKDVTTKCPYNPRGWCALAWIYKKGEDLEKCQQTLKQGLAYRPDSPDIISDYADLLYIQKDIKQSEQAFRYALSLAPTHNNATMGLGFLLLETGGFEEAAGLFGNIVRAQSENYEARYNMAKAHVGLGQLEMARTEFAFLVKKNPRAADACNNLANVLINLGRPAEAISILEESIGNGSATMEIHRALSLAYLSVGRMDDAIKSSRAALALAPNDPNAHANLALAYQQQGKMPEALEQYEIALAQYRNNERKNVLVALHVSAGDLAFQLKDTHKGITHYKAAVELDNDDNPTLRQALANVLLQAGEITDAARNYEQVLARDPRNAQACYELGLAYARLGRLDNAETSFKTALRWQPDFPEAKAALLSLRR